MSGQTITDESTVEDLVRDLGHAAMRLGVAVGRLEEAGDVERADLKLRAAIETLNLLADEVRD